MTVGRVIDGRFHLEALAGTGGMGAVYRARDAQTGATVALKLLHPSAISVAPRLAREAQALARLQHPNIVRYVAHGTIEAGLPYLAMEWLDGEDLATRLDRGPMSIADAVALGVTLADALYAAHQAGLVHRDIKPSNLWLCSSNPRSVKLLDFGIVRWHGRAMTESGMAFGTPGYMAPEQARSAGDVDTRADVYSLGCVLFEAVTGEPVFVADDLLALLTKVVMEPAPLLSDVLPGAPEAVERLFARMLDKDPDRRPVHAGLVRVELAALEIEPGPPSTSSSRRRRVVTEQELRIASLVLARSPVPTIVDRVAMNHSLEPLQAAVWPHAERVEMLADGSIAVVPVRTGSARDQANQAARCALALRWPLPGWSIAIGSGRVEGGTGSASLGQAIDRASRSLRTPEVISIDDVTAAFLDPRFEVVQREGGAHVLVGEHAQSERVRTVLGKPTPCVGRASDLAALTGYLDECVAQRRARPVVVTGPAGIGKSRLRTEFLQEVRKRGEVEVWMARGDPVSEGSPFAMIASAIRRAAHVEGAPPSVARERLRALVARHAVEDARARLVEFLGELTDIRTEGEGSIQLKAARRDPAVMGEQLTRAVTELFSAQSAAGPLLLVLEDLHWGDLPSVRALDAVLRALRDRPLMVLALARPEVHDLFPRLWSARSPATLALQELGDTAGEELVQSVLGDAIDAAAARRLVERAAGNPFFLEELIRVAARGGVETALPETVLAVVEGRLEDLSTEARRTLRAASVFGLVFWSDAVEALLGGRKASNASLDELVDREVIQRRPESRFAGCDEYAFSHALVREAAYSMLTEEDRATGHKLAAEWLEACGEHDSALLAAHFEAGREPERAVVHYERSAAHALEGNDFAAVFVRVSRAVACRATGQLLGQLRVLQARARMWSGNTEAALSSGEAALLTLTEGTPAWYDALWVVATMSSSTGNPSRVEEIALLVPHEMPDDAGSAWFSACAMVGINLLFCDRVEGAHTLLTCLERVSPAFLEENVIARALLGVLRAIWFQHAGDLGARAELLRGAIADFDLAGAVRPATRQRVGLAWALLDVGAFAEAEVLCTKILADAEQAGLIDDERGGRYCLGRALTHRGKWAEARALLEQSAAAFESGGEDRMAGAVTIALVDACLAMGDLGGASAAADKAIALVERLPPFLAQALAMRADVLLRQGRVADALTDAQEAVAPLQLGQHAVQGESRVHLVYAEVLHANGAVDAAREEIDKARAALEARAAKIGNADWRKSFLEAVPENARTLELARQWGAR